MPIYAFKCDACDHRFEELVSRIGQVAPCPKCGSEKVSRELTAPAAYRNESGGSAGEVPPCANGACQTGACPFA